MHFNEWQGVGLYAIWRAGLVKSVKGVGYWGKNRSRRQDLGRSCKGFFTKNHAVSDKFGNVRYVLKSGEESDYTQVWAPIW